MCGYKYLSSVFVYNCERGFDRPLSGESLRFLEGGGERGCCQQGTACQHRLAPLLGNSAPARRDHLHVLHDARTHPGDWTGQGARDVLRTTAECSTIAITMGSAQ